MRLRRVKWKRIPTAKEVEIMRLSTPFGPSVFRRKTGRFESTPEWLFLPADIESGRHAETPPGFVRIN